MDTSAARRPDVPTPSPERLRRHYEPESTLIYLLSRFSKLFLEPSRTPIQQPRQTTGLTRRTEEIGGLRTAGYPR